MASLPPADCPRTIAYFSMEIGLDASMPTYCGGLGVLAGDSLRAAADLQLPMVAVTLLHRRGYLRQRLDASGRQSEKRVRWSPQKALEPLDARATVTIEGRDVQVGVWRHVVRGVSGCTVPIYLLDTTLPENERRDRSLTGQLYGGDSQYRLRQEVVLGIGGIAILRALGYADIQTYHMNEGHSALLTLALLEEQYGGKPRRSLSANDADGIRSRCAFTTHTPVSAGHDKFPLGLVEDVVGSERAGLLARLMLAGDRTINLTSLAMLFSRSTNAVSARHGKVSRVMFPDGQIGSITNGVHAATWVSPPFAGLYDRTLAGWREDNDRLSGGDQIPHDEIRAAHTEAKSELLKEVQRRSGVSFDSDALTIGSARRAAGYKRADLLFFDMDRLRHLVDRRPLQIVYSGKAHAQDGTGKGAIERIFAAAAALRDEIRIVYLEDYDIALAKLLVAGADLWLNTPQKPLEASGTSGMKAALNGVPSLSVLDGWWLEGCVEGVTGWAIGDDSEESADPATDAASLYDKLERVILPMFYEQPLAYAEVMRGAIARNGSHFTTQRMMSQYAREVYEVAVSSVS